MTQILVLCFKHLWSPVKNAHVKRVSCKRRTNCSDIVRILMSARFIEDFASEMFIAQTRLVALHVDVDKDSKLSKTGVKTLTSVKIKVNVRKMLFVKIIREIIPANVILVSRESVVLILMSARPIQLIVT